MPVKKEDLKVGCEYYYDDFKKQIKKLLFVGKKKCCI